LALDLLELAAWRISPYSRPVTEPRSAAEDPAGRWPPHDPVEINFAHDGSADAAPSTVARWPRHRVVATVACGLAVLVLGVIATGGLSIFSPGTPTAANPIHLPLAPPASRSATPTSTPSVAGSPTRPARSSRPTASPTHTAAPPTTPTVRSAAAPLSASYRTTDTWNGGYSGEITLTAPRALSTWTVTITLPASAVVSTAWEAQVHGSGATWTFTPQSWSADVAPDAPVTFGFQVDGGGPNHPLSCAIGDQSCAGG
jgi:hypothetical protein